MKFMKLRILLMLLISILTTTSLYSQEWTHGDGIATSHYSVEVAAYDSNTVFVGSIHHGIWRRNLVNDSCWTAINNGITPKEWDMENVNFWYYPGSYSGSWFLGDYVSIRSIATSERLSDVVYAGDEDGNIYKSINNGETWEPQVTLEGRASNVITELKINPEFPEIVYAISDRILYISSDGGGSWIENDLQYTKSLAIDPANGNHLFVSVASYVSESFDNGVTWEELPYEFGATAISRLLINPTNPERLYAWGENIYSEFDTFRTNNSGQSWDWIAAAPTVLWFLKAIRYDGTIIGTRINYPPLYYSSDHGTSFQIFPMQNSGPHLEHFYQRSMDFLGETSDDFISAGHGVFSSRDGGETFEFIDEGFNKGYISEVKTAPESSDTLYAYSEVGIFKSVDCGVKWERINSAPIIAFDVSPVDVNRLIAASRGYLYRSFDGGEEWVMSLYGGNNKVLCYQSTSPNRVYIGTSSGIQESTNSGVNWNYIFETAVSEIFIDPYDTDAIWACGEDLYFRSSNDEWYTYDTPGECIDAVRVGTVNSHPIYISCADSVCVHSTGVSWRSISEELPRIHDGEFWKLEPVPNENAFLLVMRGQGIYHYNCDTEVWTLIEGDYDRRVTDVEINDFGKIIISTAADGVWVSDYITPVSVDPRNDIELPTSVLLDDPYPNPFNSTVAIPFSLPTDANVTFTLFDILGREVYKSSQEYSSGSHTKVLNSESDFVSNVASGIYFVQMKTDASVLTKSASARFTKKVMLLR
jgi:Secretion system C-terminal sorting domain